MTISIKSPTSTTGSIQKNGSDVLTIDSSDNVTVVNDLSVSGDIAVSTDLSVSGNLTVTGNVPTSNTGPAFSAYKGSNQSLTAGAYTKITYEAEDFDTNSNYDTSTSRFTPSVAGYYYVTACTAYVAGTSIEVAMGIYKNGIHTKRIFDMINPDGRQSGGSALIYMNGSTDYIEIFQYSSVNLLIASGSLWTYFQAHLVRAA